MTWFDDRGRLNHDVLANWIENELSNIESEPDRACLRLEQFLDRENDFRRLLDEAPRALSTARILDDPLFDVWTDDIRSEIRTYANALFHATSGVPEQVISLYPLLDKCLEATRMFIATNPQKRTASQVKVMRKLFYRLRAGISSLPVPFEQYRQDHR